MRFFLDQCVPRSINVFLNRENHDVFPLGDYLPTDAMDHEVIPKAQILDTILVSLNGDFANIITYPSNKFQGIIGLQVRNRPEAIPHILTRLNTYLKSHPKRDHYVGKLLLVEPHRIRIKQ